METLLPPQVKEDEAPKLLLRGFVPGSPPAEPGGALAVDGHKSDTSDRSGTHPLTPGDFTRIFGTIKPQLKTATEDTPYSLVVAGQSQFDPSRLGEFRRRFDLGDPQLIITLVPSSLDPGIRKGDDQQLELDLAWASAVAQHASLHVVYSDDVTDAVQYAIDQNLAPVLIMSYGECLTSSLTDVQTMRIWAKQANAQGIRWVSASGDSGAGGCYQSTQSQ